MKKDAKLLIGLACLSLGLTACSDDKFDQEAYDNLVLQAFPVTNVDPTHNWSVFGTATVDVAVNSGINEEYRVAVYKENPKTNTQLTQLAKGTVAASSNVKLTVDFELAEPTVYVAIYTSDNRRAVHAVTLTNGETAYVDFLGTRGLSRETRSQVVPEVKDINAPYDAAWVTEYLQNAKEPDSQNIYDNYDDSRWVPPTEDHWEEGIVWGCGWNDNSAGGKLYYNRDNPDYNFVSNGISIADYQWFYENCMPYINGNYTFYDPSYITEAYANDALTDLIGMLRSTGRGDWMNVWKEGSKRHFVEGKPGYWEYIDPTYVRSFKITNSWSGSIQVAQSEGLNNGIPTNSERTVVVTGTWNLTETQRVGSLGKIIVANGGTINISAYQKLELVNQARLVVLAGGKILGDGNVEVTNGNAEGQEGYNAGIIDVGKFNNNFGKFFNYGTFKANIYAGGAQESNFYNHGIVNIKGTKENGNYVAPNARIFNACQWYCSGDMGARILEETGGASFIVDGELKMEASADGTTTPSYIALAAGALVRCGTLYNNNASWTGPTSGGYAVLSAGRVTYLNWAQETYPLDYGYFENNIYIQLDDGTNNPNGNNVWVDGEFINAEWKILNILANGRGQFKGTAIRGNGHTDIVYAGENGATEIIPADNGFVKGVKGCTPGFSAVILEKDYEEEITPQGYRFCFEDNFPSPGDYDFNDVVITVIPEVNGNEVDLKVSLDAVGATKQIAAALRIKGLDPSWVWSAACDNDLNRGWDINQYIIASNRGNNIFQVEPQDLTTNDYVLCLFNDAHYSLIGNTEVTGGVYHYMLNTIKNGDTELEEANKYPSFSANFHFVLNSNQHAEIFSQENLDVFIVERHNGLFWEVHTFPFKFDQVLSAYYGETKLDPYEGNTSVYPWAICAPSNFRYPIEWHSICGSKIEITQAYGFGEDEVPYKYFADWAVDKNTHLQWYSEKDGRDDRYVYPLVTNDN